MSQGTAGVPAVWAEGIKRNDTLPRERKKEKRDTDDTGATHFLKVWYAPGTVVGRGMAVTRSHPTLL